MSNGNILQLVPKLKQSAPPGEAIAMLEDMLDRLRSGAITDVAVAAVDTKSNELHTAWFGWSGHLIAPAELLAARLMSDLRGR